MVVTQADVDRILREGLEAGRSLSEILAEIDRRIREEGFLDEFGDVEPPPPPPPPAVGLPPPPPPPRIVPPPPVFDVEIPSTPEEIAALIRAEGLVTRGELEATLALLVAELPPPGVSIEILNQVIGAVTQSLTDRILRVNEDLLREIADSEIRESAARGEAILSLRTEIVTQQSAIQDRLDAFERESQESSGLGFVGLIRFIGSFALAPFDFVLEAGRGTIVSEINDGLNR